MDVTERQHLDAVRARLHQRYPDLDPSTIEGMIHAAHHGFDDAGSGTLSRCWSNSRLSDRSSYPSANTLPEVTGDVRRRVPAGLVGYSGRKGGDRMTTHDSIRHWIAEQMHLDIETAQQADLAKLDAVTAAAEAGYVRALLHLRHYRPLVG